MTRVSRAFISAPLMPEFDREGGSQRIFNLIELLRARGWAVTFLAQNALPDTKRYARILQQMGVTVYAGSSTWWADDEYIFDMSPLIEHGKFDLAIFAFWYVAETFIPLFRHFSPSTRLLVDSIDLHFLRLARMKFSSPGPGQAGSGSGELDEVFADEMRRELNVYAAADGVLAVSRKEADLINDFVGRPDQAHLLPLLEDLPASKVAFEKRRGILFIGNFRHTPNKGAVEFLCKEVVPEINPALLAEHPLYIVGNGLDKEISKLGENLPGVKMVGWVPSLLPYLQNARISIAPLLTGAGTKTKLIQALTVGTPTVSTTIGTEGLGLCHGQETLIADTASDFARNIETLLTDKDLWTRLSNQGRSHIRLLHSPEAVAGHFWSLVDGVVAKPEPGE